MAMTLLLLPDIKDPSGRLAPAQNRTIAKNILVACSAAKDPFATMQIINGSYLSNEYTIRQAEDLAAICSAADLALCKSTLKELANRGDGNCLTMQGLLLQKAGLIAEAKGTYREALRVIDFRFDRKWPHPGALPWIPPWRALADLLLSGPAPTAEAREEARDALKRGALEGDDPLAYWQLASFESDRTVFWYKCMTKAAASGHIKAAYNLAHFHLDASKESSPILENREIRALLNYAISWKGNSLERLALEWFNVAALGGHKPAMLELAEHHAANGDAELAMDYYRLVTEPPPPGELDEWPQLVKQAKLKITDLQKRQRKSLS